MSKLKPKTEIESDANLPATRPAAAVPARAEERNPFQAYGDAAGNSFIVGELLKFSKGDWLVGQSSEELPANTTLVAGMETLAIGWQRWAGQKPVEHRLGLLVDGFRPPNREDLGELDQALWETDEVGNPKDPWVRTNYLQLIDPADKDRVLTFTTSSKGGLSAIAKPCAEYGRMVERENRGNQYPLVRLDTGSYLHRDRSLGRIKFPSLEIVEWVDKETLAPIKDPIGDEIPY